MRIKSRKLSNRIVKSLIFTLVTGMYISNNVEAAHVVDIDNIDIDECVYGNNDNDYTIKPQNNSYDGIQLNIQKNANIKGNIYAAYSEGKNNVLSNNIVNLFDVNFSDKLQVLGAWSIAGESNNNEVNIYNSVIPLEVVGGKTGNVQSGKPYSTQTVLTDNTKLISQNNRVNMYSGKVDSIIGGSVKVQDNGSGTTSADSSYNTVNVYEGEVSSVVGGLINSTNSNVKGVVSNNTVSIYGGNIEDVIGGSVSYDAYDNLIVKDNTVNWYGGNITGYIIGDSVAKWNPNSNSTFNFYASLANSNKSIAGLENFKNYHFYIDNTVLPGSTLIKVNNTVDLRNSNIGVAMTSGAALNIGDNINLLETQGLKTDENLVNNPTNMDGYAGNLRSSNIYDVYDFTLVNNGYNLNATVGKVTPNSQNEVIPESRQPEVAFLDDKLDIVDTAYNMSVGKSEPVIYFDFNYTDVKKDNVTMRGSENVLGSALTKGDEEKKNTITQGPFLEYGDGSFGGKNFYSTGDVDASGKTEKYGTGYLFRQVRAGRHHYDAYFRLGKIKNDFRSHMYGVGNVNYDNSDMYYAAHLGYGQYIPIDHHTKMDVYGKYFYKLIPGTSTTTHVNSDTDINTDFDKLDSHKFRIGSKITWDYMQEKKKMMFADVAIEHELSHTQRTTLGDRVTSNSSGADTTGVIEIGYRQVFGPKDAFLFTADLQGYVGTRSGLGGNIGVRFNF